MKLLRAICFDVDGVLLDSLGAHLQVCADKSRKYGLNVPIPAPEFQQLESSGIKISPMEKLFEAVGFPLNNTLNGPIRSIRLPCNGLPDKPFPEVAKNG